MGKKMNKNKSWMVIGLVVVALLVWSDVGFGETNYYNTGSQITHNGIKYTVYRRANDPDNQQHYFINPNNLNDVFVADSFAGTKTLISPDLKSNLNFYNGINPLEGYLTEEAARKVQETTPVDGAELVAELDKSEFEVFFDQWRDAFEPVIDKVTDWSSDYNEQVALAQRIEGTKLGMEEAQKLSAAAASERVRQNFKMSDLDNGQLKTDSGTYKIDDDGDLCKKTFYFWCTKVEVNSKEYTDVFAKSEDLAEGTVNKLKQELIQAQRSLVQSLVQESRPTGQAQKTDAAPTLAKEWDSRGKSYFLDVMDNDGNPTGEYYYYDSETKQLMRAEAGLRGLSNERDASAEEYLKLQSRITEKDNKINELESKLASDSPDKDGFKTGVKDLGYAEIQERIRKLAASDGEDNKNLLAAYREETTRRQNLGELTSALKDAIDDWKSGKVEVKDKDGRLIETYGSKEEAEKVLKEMEAELKKNRKDYMSNLEKENAAIVASWTSLQEAGNVLASIKEWQAFGGSLRRWFDDTWLTTSLWGKEYGEWVKAFLGVKEYVKSEICDKWLEDVTGAYGGDAAYVMTDYGLMDAAYVAGKKYDVGLAGAFGSNESIQKSYVYKITYKVSAIKGGVTFMAKICTGTKCSGCTNLYDDNVKVVKGKMESRVGSYALLVPSNKDYKSVQLAAVSGKFGEDESSLCAEIQPAGPDKIIPLEDIGSGPGSGPSGFWSVGGFGISGYDPCKVNDDCGDDEYCDEGKCEDLEEGEDRASGAGSSGKSDDKDQNENTYQPPKAGV